MKNININLCVVLLGIGSVIGDPTRSLAGGEGLAAYNNAYEDLRHSVVRIRVAPPESANIEPDRYLGTGFVAPGCVVVTAKHLFRDLSDEERQRIVIRIDAPLRNGESINVKSTIIYADPDPGWWGIALLRFLPVAQCNALGVRPFQLATALELGKLMGERVTILGFPSLASAQLQIANVPFNEIVMRESIVTGGMMFTSQSWLIGLGLTRVPGLEGSPVVLKKSGQVIGVALGPSKSPDMSGSEWAAAITMKDYNEAVEQALDRQRR